MEQGRFGEFVTKTIDTEFKRRKEAAEKENDMKIWDLYLHSMTDKSFFDFKNDLMQSTSQQPQSYKMTNAQVEQTINRSRQILKNSKIK